MLRVWATLFRSAGSRIQPPARSISAHFNSKISALLAPVAIRSRDAGAEWATHDGRGPPHGRQFLVAEHPVAPHLRRRLLDVRRRVRFDQIATGGPPKQPLDMREHAVGSNRRAVGDAIDHRDDVALAHLLDRHRANVGQHLAHHDAANLLRGPIPGLVPSKPLLDDGRHGPCLVNASPLGRALGRRIAAEGNLAEKALGLAPRLLDRPRRAVAADGRAPRRRGPTSACAILQDEGLHTALGDHQAEALEVAVEVDGAAVAALPCPPRAWPRQQLASSAQRSASSSRFDGSPPNDVVTTG